MNREESIRLTAHIARIIDSGQSVVNIIPGEINSARNQFTDEDISSLQAAGFYYGDFELFYVVNKFLLEYNIWDSADDAYIRLLFKQARKYSPEFLSENDYIKRIPFSDRKIDNFYLTTAKYEKYELLEYDMPNLSADGMVVPYLSFFTGEAKFPTIYEGVMPWMSVCPSEINSMKKEIRMAKGRCLVLGLGLGYYPFEIAKSQEVLNITVVELSDKVIDLFNKYIYPYIPNKEKIKIVKADAIKYLEKVESDDYDFCFADIWEGQEDGAYFYKQIKPYEKKLPGMKFTYWIEDAIKLWIDED